MTDDADDEEVEVEEADATEYFTKILKRYRKPGDPNLGGLFMKLPMVWLDEAFHVLPPRHHRVAIAIGHLGAYLVDKNPHSRPDVPFQVPASALTLFGTTERQVNDGLRKLAKAGLIHLATVKGKPSIIRVLTHKDDLAALTERYRKRLRATRQGIIRDAQPSAVADRKDSTATPPPSALGPADVARALAANGFARRGDEADGFKTWEHPRRGVTLRIFPADEHGVRVIIDGAESDAVKASFGAAGRRITKPARGTAISDSSPCWVIRYDSAAFPAEFIAGLRKSGVKAPRIEP